MLLVVVEDVLDGLDTGVLGSSVLLLVGSLVPVENTADEGRDEESTGLSGGNGLDQREHEGQVAVDAVLGLQDVRSLDTLPGRGDLDENTVLGDTNGLVELVIVSSQFQSRRHHNRPYLDDVKGLVDGGLGVEREAGIDLRGDLSGDDLEDLLSELNQEVVQGGIDLLLDSLSLLELSVPFFRPTFFFPFIRRSNGASDEPPSCPERRQRRSEQHTRASWKQPESGTGWWWHPEACTCRWLL